MFPVQNKYKEEGLRSLSQSLYSKLPETAETQLAKTVAELQSEVRLVSTLFYISCLLFLFIVKLISPRCPAWKRASQSKYREASKKEAKTCLYHQLPETLETRHAKEASELQSQVHVGVRSSFHTMGLIRTVVVFLMCR